MQFFSSSSAFRKRSWCISSCCWAISVLSPSGVYFFRHRYSHVTADPPIFSTLRYCSFAAETHTNSAFLEFFIVFFCVSVIVISSFFCYALSYHFVHYFNTDPRSQKRMTGRYAKQMRYPRNFRARSGRLVITASTPDTSIRSISSG